MRTSRIRFLVGMIIGFGLAAAAARSSFGAFGAVAGFSPAAGLAAATMAVLWSVRRRVAPLFVLCGAAVAWAAGVPLVEAGVYGGAIVLEGLIAVHIVRRSIDPLERPATSAWWAYWGLASAVGVAVGGLVFALGASHSDLAAALVPWFIGHWAGLMLVAPTTWVAEQWWQADRWRHVEDLRAMARALAWTTVATVGASVAAWFTHRAFAFVAPVAVLARIAHSAGHRVTITASSIVASSLLLAMPVWIHESTGWTPGSATVTIVLAHIAFSALAIEASARWHARALLSGVVDISNDAVLVIDAGGRVMTGNATARRVFGGRLEGAALSDVFPELSPWELVEVSGRTVQGVSLTGAPLLMEVSVGTVEAPGRPMMAVVCRDMSEIVAAAESLQRSAEIIDHAPDLVAWTDPGANLLFLNRAGRAMIGASTEGPIDPWSAAGLVQREAIDGAAAHGAWSDETWIVSRSGHRIPVLQTVVAHRSDNGAIRFFSILARDITERYELEQMKTEFASNVTHELRSPLTGILGYLSLLLDDAFGELDDEVRSALADVRGSADQLLELIDDLLALWRVEDRGTAVTEELDLESVVHGAARSIRPIAIGKRIELDVDTEPVLVVGDRKQLERAFINVISNAVKFTPAGGKVSVSLSAEVGIGVVRITDTGVGIPERELDSIFERFYRASTAENADIPGTGLGLPLVKQTIESHGGSVCVESEVGHGTSFHLTLPTLVRARPIAV